MKNIKKTLKSKRKILKIKRKNISHIYIKNIYLLAAFCQGNEHDDFFFCCQESRKELSYKEIIN